MENLNKPITLRPHHGLCIRHFVGHGYSNEFTTNMRQVIELLNGNPQQEILLQCSADVLCNACPHNQNGICSSIEKVDLYDIKCLSLCNLKKGQTISWQSFTQLIEKYLIANNQWELVCTGCNWLTLCRQINKEKQTKV